MVKKAFRNTAFIIILLTLIGGLLRTYRIGEVPVGFHADEAYFGYNAYSLLKTLRDSTGHLLPIHFESFLYSPGGYSYLIVPFIVLFDLTPLAVRLPGALVGTGTIVLTFFLVRKIFSQSHRKTWIAVVATLLLTLSPWHINLSRVSAENVVVVFLISLGVLLYLTWIEKEKKFFLIFSFLSFASTYLLYQGPRAFLPLFIPVLVVLFYRKKEIRKYLLTGTLYLLLIIVPLLFIVNSNTLSYRLKMLSVFEFPKTYALLHEAITEDGKMGQSRIVARIFHNKVTGYTAEIFETYMKHFSYDFLFKDQGLPARYRVPNMGLLYIFELPLLIAGVYAIIRSRSKGGLLCISWVLLGFVGSALTYDDVPNLQQTLLIFPALQAISGFGGVALFSSLNRRVAPFILLGSVPVVLFFVMYYLHQYYVHQFIHTPVYRQEGYEELVTSVNGLLSDYEYASITTRHAAPLIFFLFYTKYDPVKFQMEIKQQEHNFLVEDFGKVSINKYKFFTDECADKSMLKESVLYVDLGSCYVPYDSVTVLKEIKRGDDSVIFRVYEKKREGEKEK